MIERCRSARGSTHVHAIAETHLAAGVRCTSSALAAGGSLHALACTYAARAHMHMGTHEHMHALKRTLQAGVRCTHASACAAGSISADAPRQFLKRTLQQLYASA